MRAIAALLAGLLAAGVASAQGYPNRPVKVVVPWPPGQATDVAARLVAQRLQEALGQPFVIDNRAGAGGSIGSDVVAKSAPDGYTLLAASSGPISVMPNLQKTPYDAARDFAPVSLIALSAYALVVHPSFPAANAQEFVALLRANPDKYAFASSGTGATGHLILELFNSMAGIKARHVPYKGSAPAMTDVMNGQVAYSIDTVAGVINYVKSGKLKAYGVSFARPSAAMPEAPTLAQAANLPGFDIGAWIGYSAPAGTPPAVLNRISGEIQKAMQAPELRQRYMTMGLDPASSTPEETAAFLRKEHERYGAVIRNAGITLEK